MHATNKPTLKHNRFGQGTILT